MAAPDQIDHLYNGFGDTTMPRTQEQINGMTAGQAAFNFQARVQDASAPRTSFQQPTFQRPVHGHPRPRPYQYRRPCVFWERGYCCNNTECTYLHRDSPRQQAAQHRWQREQAERKQAQREQAEKFEGFQRYVKEHDERLGRYQRDQRERIEQRRREKMLFEGIRFAQQQRESQRLQTQQGMYTPQGARTGPLLVPREHQHQQQSQQYSSMQHQQRAHDRYGNMFTPMTTSEVEHQRHYKYTPAGAHGGIFTRMEPTLEQQYQYQQRMQPPQPQQVIPRTMFSEAFMTTGAAAPQEQTWSQRIERDGTSYIYMTPAVEHQLYMAGHLTLEIQQQQIMARVEVGDYEQQYAPPQY